MRIRQGRNTGNGDLRIADKLTTELRSQFPQANCRSGQSGTSRLEISLLWPV